MEAASVYAGEPWSDRPKSVSAVLGAVLRRLNDCMGDTQRRELRGLIPLLVGSHRDDQVEIARSWMLADWHCRTWPATFLEAIGCGPAAQALAATAAIQGDATLSAVREPLEAGRAASSALRADAVRISLEETIKEAAEATGVGLDEPAIADAASAIRAYGRGPAVRELLMSVPVAAGWDAGRSRSWRGALDAAPFKYTAAADEAHVESVRAIFATSAWGSGWEVARRAAPAAWDDVTETARSIGRDAALILAWRRGLAPTAAELQRSLIDRVIAAIEAHADAGG